MNPKILCIVPALPSEVRLETLRSIFNQSVSVAATILLTEKVSAKLPFPAKISLVMNNMLKHIRLEDFDYLLRVDADTVLPVDFIEKNLEAECAVIGYGPAQLIDMRVFIKFMGGRFHPEHDDGYPLFKFKECGLKVQINYVVAPVIQRKPGFHRGFSWFISQGELNYRYGYDILYELGIVAYSWRKNHPYGVFYLVGYFKALLQRKSLFDVGSAILARNMRRYRHPSRLLRVFTVSKYRNKMIGLIHK